MISVLVRGCVFFKFYGSVLVCLSIELANCFVEEDDGFAVLLQIVINLI